MIFLVGTEHCLATWAMTCRAPISYGEANRWASHAEGRNVGQALVAYNLAAHTDV